MGTPKVAVLDTNVLVSAVGWRGPERRLYEYCRARKLQLATSSALLMELERVLRYPKLKLDDSRIESFVEGLLEHAIVVEPQRTIHVITMDPDDDRVIECAEAARADWFVSGDGHLLSLAPYDGIRILTTTSALQVLAEQTI